MTDQTPEPAMVALAGLAREMDALRRTVDGLAVLPAQLAQLADVVAGLGGRGRPELTQAPAGLPSWLEFSGDFAETVTVLGELAGWMRTVYLRYADAAAGLPECWLWHPDLVEELLWLRGAWFDAYRGPAATTARAGDWHDRQRPGVTRRIRAVAGTCSLESHQPGGDRHRGAEPVPLADAIHLLGEWWSAGRDACPPVPDAGHIASAARARAPRRRA